MNTVKDLTTSFNQQLVAKGYSLSKWKMALVGASLCSLTVGLLLKEPSSDNSADQMLAKSTNTEQSVPNNTGNEFSLENSSPKNLGTENSFVGSDWVPPDPTTSSDSSTKPVDQGPTGLPTIDDFPKKPASSQSAQDTQNQQPASSGTDFSPLFLKGGFGLFLGFSIGFALRVFLRMAAFIAGANLLLLLFFSYIGWVEVNWDFIQTQLEPVVNNLGSQFESFKTFIAGSIPMAGMSTVGIAAGLRKK